MTHASHHLLRRLIVCAMIAAIYAVLTVLTASFAYGPVQFRLAEALCVLPLFLPYTSWGLMLGCLIANLFSTVSALDIVVGTAATALACGLLCRWRKPAVAVLAPVLCNGVIVGAMLAWLYMPGEAFLKGFAICGGEVALGELVVMLALGLPQLLLLRRTKLPERLDG